MKIAIFSDFFYPELSGVADSITTTALELVRLGHEVDLFVPNYSAKDYTQGGVNARDIDLGTKITVHRVSSFSISAPTMQGRAYIPHIFRAFLPHKKFDIVHSHGFFGAGIDAWLFAKLTGTPLVATNHTLIESFDQYLPDKGFIFAKLVSSYLIWYYNRSLLVSTPSGFLLSEMKKKGLKANAIVVSNPIDNAFFEVKNSKVELKRELHLSPCTALYVGRLSKEKGVQVILDSFIPCAKNHSDANLVFVGGGILRKTLIDTIKEHGLSSQITVVGPFVGSEKVHLYKYFQASDLFITASTSETQSMTTLQAMAAKLPIVAASAAALPEIVGTERGILFPHGNRESLTGILEKFYNHEVNLEEISKHCGEYAAQRTATQIGKIWESIYTETIQTHA